MLLGAALRLYAISSVPTELVPDEIDLYNSAYSIATTGHDIDGSLEPFLYSRFTRNPPMYALFAYASVAIFGRTPLGIRLPAAILGLVAVMLIYAIALELTRRRDIAMLAALFQAILPIFVLFSRVGWEPASELPFLLGGLFLLLRAYRRGESVEPASLFAAAVLLGLTSYTYMAGWVYAVVLGGAIIALNYRRLASDGGKVAGAVALWLALSAPALWMWFGDPSTFGKVQSISTFGGGVSLATLETFARNYLAHLQWSYLVMTGDPRPGETWRYLVGFGAFYWWVFPLTVAGLIANDLYVQARWARGWLWLWLLAYPLGGALTDNAIPSAPRTLAGAPIFCMLSAIGFVAVVNALPQRTPQLVARWWRRLLCLALAACAAVSVAHFSVSYFTRYVHVYSNAWDSGTRALFAQIAAHTDSYRRICFSVRSAWYETGSYVRFYLPHTPLRVYDEITDPPCFRRGTLIAISDQPLFRPGFLPVVRVVDVDGNPFATLYARR